MLSGSSTSNSLGNGVAAAALLYHRGGQNSGETGVASLAEVVVPAGVADVPVGVAVMEAALLYGDAGAAIELAPTALAGTARFLVPRSTACPNAWSDSSWTPADGTPRRSCGTAGGLPRTSGGFAPPLEAEPPEQPLPPDETTFAPDALVS